MKRSKLINTVELAKHMLQNPKKETIQRIRFENLKINIKLTDFGIAYAYDNTIEINRKLLQYPKLLEKVLEHEIEHIEKPSFLDAVKIEFKDAFDFGKHRLLSSCLRKHPIMKLQASLPVWYHKGEISFNVFLLVLYIVLISLMYFAISLYF